MKSLQVSDEIHTVAKTFASSHQQKLQAFTEAAIREKIERETPKEAKKDE